MRRARAKNCMIELPSNALMSYPCACQHKVLRKSVVSTKIHTPPKINAPPSLLAHTRQLQELQNATKYLQKKEQELRRKTEELKKVIKTFEARKQEHEREKENIIKRFSKLKDDVKRKQQNCTCKLKPRSKQNLCSRRKTEMNDKGKQIVKEKAKKNKQLLRKDIYNTVYNRLMNMQVKPRLLDRLNALLLPPPSMWPNWYWLRQLIPSPCSCGFQGLTPLRSPFTECSMGNPRRYVTKTLSGTINQTMQSGDCKSEIPQKVPYEVLSHGLLLFAAALAWLPCLFCVALCKCCCCMCCYDFW